MSDQRRDDVTDAVPAERDDLTDAAPAGRDTAPAGRDTVAPERDSDPADAARRRPSPGALAASRARRIGGRPLPGPRGGAEGEPTAVAPTAPQSSGAADGAARRAPHAARQAVATAEPARADQPAEATDVAALQRRLDRVRWTPAWIAAAAIVALLVIGAWQSYGVWWGSRLHDTRDEVQEQVLAAAKPCTAAILSYDYRRLDAAQQAGEKCITGTFKSQYDQSMQVVRQLAPQSKTVQAFEVAKGGVQSVSADGRQWTVLLFGQISVTNSTTQPDSPRLDVATAVVTLDRVGNSWLVANMQTGG